MTPPRVCSGQGKLVSGETRLATDPCEFHNDALIAPVGCGRLRCSNCGEWVRSGPPGLTIKSGATIDTVELYYTLDWTKLSAFDFVVPPLRNGDRCRFYACKCSRWESDYSYSMDTERDSPNDPDLPWLCGGHPSPKLPITLGELSISTPPDWAGVVDKILRGACPRDLELPKTLDAGPTVWLGWLYNYLRGLPEADDLSFAIAKRYDDNDPSVVGRVLFFFKRFPMANGVEHLVARAEHDPYRVAVGYPVPESCEATTLWDVLAARLAIRTNGDVLGERIDAVVRRVLLIPIASLPHISLGPTNLIEGERNRFVGLGWDEASAMDHAKFLVGKPRSDIVAHELDRSPGAFNDPDLRIFMTDHILQIDAAGPGRWKGVMTRLTDWLNKPEQGHLIVVAGARVIRAKIVSNDEFRAWMKDRCGSGWRDDAWVLPLESMLEG